MIGEMAGILALMSVAAVVPGGGGDSGGRRDNTAEGFANIPLILPEDRNRDDEDEVPEDTVEPRPIPSPLISDDEYNNVLPRNRAFTRMVAVGDMTFTRRMPPATATSIDEYWETRMTNPGPGQMILELCGYATNGFTITQIRVDIRDMQTQVVSHVPWLIRANPAGMGYSIAVHDVPPDTATALADIAERDARNAYYVALGRRVHTQSMYRARALQEDTAAIDIPPTLAEGAAGDRPESP